MKVAQIPKAGADFQIVEREIPKPEAGQVLIKVQACGVCHSDVLTKEGTWPGIQYPRVPGHEVAGIIDQVGADVSAWKKGQRVGVGWHGGQDGTCISCRRGDFRNCRNLKIPGISYDGGYQQYMVAPVEALVAIPESLGAVEAAPLLCAGITTFNAPRGTAARSLATSSRYRVSAVWATSEFNSRISLVTRPWPSGAGPKMRSSPRNSERACISTANPPTPQRNYKNWAARR
jgi:D-arabinose 1-dehydrogenase-like Zn-dependent alcohol dehydrogenase